LVCLQKLIIQFPPDKYDFHNSVSLNVVASKAATSAVIVGHSSNDLEFFIDRIFLERQYRHFRLCANRLPHFHFSLIAVEGGLTSGLA